MNANGTIATVDLMSYAPANLWFSVYDYCKAMHHLPRINPTCYPGWSQ